MIQDFHLMEGKIWIFYLEFLIHFSESWFLIFFLPDYQMVTNMQAILEIFFIEWVLMIEALLLFQVLYIISLLTFVNFLKSWNIFWNYTFIGAHAVGRCHTDRSGFWGPWTHAESTLSNEYFRLMFEEKWTPKKTHKGTKFLKLFVYIFFKKNCFQAMNGKAHHNLKIKRAI